MVNGREPDIKTLKRVSCLVYLVADHAGSLSNMHSPLCLSYTHSPILFRVAVCSVKELCFPGSYVAGVLTQSGQ